MSRQDAGRGNRGGSRRVAGPGKSGERGGALRLSGADSLFLASDRLELLDKIRDRGSIAEAARAAGISYKTAWDVVNDLNDLSDKPVVVRRAGGRKGGGTLVTEEGREIIRRYRVLQQEHRKFLESLSKRLGDVDSFYRFLRRIAMKVSARNTFLGKIAEIKRGAVSAEVTLSLKGGDAIVAVITNQSLDSLGLSKGKEAYAIVKASSVILGIDLHDARISARNVLCGTVAKLAEGPVNAEVALSLPGGNTLTAVITEESLKRLGLAVGGHACAAVKASSVILGVG